MFHRQIIDTQTMFHCYVRLQEGIQVCITWFLGQVHNFYPFPAPKIPASDKGKEFMPDANHWQETNIYIYIHIYICISCDLYLICMYIMWPWTHIYIYTLYCCTLYTYTCCYARQRFSATICELVLVFQLEKNNRHQLTNGPTQGANSSLCWIVSHIYIWLYMYTYTKAGAIAFIRFTTHWVTLYTSEYEVVSR